MEELSAETFARMQKEDSWIRSENGVLLLSYTQRLNDNPCDLETTIQIAELETIKHSQSAALHCYLGSQYHLLTKELSDGSKIEIERRKLQEIGREDILDLESKTMKEILASLPHEGNDIGESVRAATDLLHSWNISKYLGMNNVEREFKHLDISLDLSGQNPEVFKNIIEPIISLKISQLATIYLGRAENEGYYVGDSFSEGFASHYISARKRLGLD